MQKIWKHSQLLCANDKIIWKLLPEVYTCVSELPVEYSQYSTNLRAASQVGNVVRIDMFWSITDCTQIC